MQQKCSLRIVASTEILSLRTNEERCILRPENLSEKVFQRKEISLAANIWQSLIFITQSSSSGWVKQPYTIIVQVPSFFKYKDLTNCFEPTNVTKNIISIAFQFPSVHMIRLMAEILHHLGCMKAPLGQSKDGDNGTTSHGFSWKKRIIAKHE